VQPKSTVIVFFISQTPPSLEGGYEKAPTWVEKFPLEEVLQTMKEISAKVVVY
jgi:hypothetical protein